MTSALLENVSALAEQMQALARQAHTEYSAEVDAVIDTGDVQEKATAAAQYCKHATDFTTKNKGKPWKYVIIPHNAVLANMSFHTLAVKYEYKDDAATKT